MRSINNIRIDRARTIDTQIEELKKQMQTIQTKIDTLTQEQSKLWNTEIFNRKSSLKVITYLVNLMEEKNYVLQEKEIKVPFKSSRLDLSHRPIYDIMTYKLVYLIEPGVNVDEKINKLFPENPINDPQYKEYKDDRGIMQGLYNRWLIHSESQSEALETPQEGYIQLTYYTKEDGNEIVFSKKYNFDHDNKSGVGKSRVESKICDPKYHYIVDFMNEVAKYRIEKEDLEVTEEEMFNLATSFVTEKKREEDSLTEKSDRAI